MQNKELVKFYWDCGRMGSVEGLFITTEAKRIRSIGEEVYFGEILGKHSEVYGTIKEEDFTVKSTDQDFINKLEELLGSDISGYNPLSYLNETEVDESWLEMGDIDCNGEEV